MLWFWIPPEQFFFIEKRDFQVICIALLWLGLKSCPDWTRIQFTLNPDPLNVYSIYIVAHPYSKIIILQLTETLPLISHENHVQPCMCNAWRDHVSRTLPPNGWYWAACCFSFAVNCMSTVAYVCRTHAILGSARRASRERELLELRILHKRQHLVHSERWPVSKYWRKLQSLPSSNPQP